MSFLRSSFSPKSYFPPVWFAEADDSHLLEEEQSGGMVAAIAERESRRLAAFRRQIAEQQAFERKLAAERQAQIDADQQAAQQAELDSIEQERQRVASIIAYKAPAVSPVLTDISQNSVEIAPELLQKLASISQQPIALSSINAPKIEASEPDYSEDIALIMILLEAA